MEHDDSHDPFGPSTSTAHAQAQGSTSSNTNSSSNNSSVSSGAPNGSLYRTVTAGPFDSQSGVRQLTDLEKAMVVTSPSVERSNPLGMHVHTKQRRKSSKSMAASSEVALAAQHGYHNTKGKTTGNMPDNGMSGTSSSEEDNHAALEPKEAIRQQFQVSIMWILKTKTLFDSNIDSPYTFLLFSCAGVQCTSKDLEHSHT